MLFMESFKKVEELSELSNAHVSQYPIPQWAALSSTCTARYPIYLPRAEEETVVLSHVDVDLCFPCSENLVGLCKFREVSPIKITLNGLYS